MKIQYLKGPDSVKMGQVRFTKGKPETVSHEIARAILDKRSIRFYPVGVKAVMLEMIRTDEGLGRDGIPDLKDIRKRTPEEVTAGLRDKLMKEIKEED